MLREGERPPVDKNYNNNNNKKLQNNQIINEDQQEQPEWADFTSQQIKVGDKNQNKWGLTMSQDRNTILGIKTKEDSQSKTNQASETQNQQQQQQLEVSMGQISAGQLNSPTDPTIIKAQSRPKDLSAIEQQESKLGVTTESNNSIQNVQIQKKFVDNTLKQKKKIDQKLDGVFQAPAIPQNSYSQYPTINRQQYNPYQQTTTTPNNSTNNSNNNMYYDAYNHQNNLYYAAHPSTNIQQPSAINPSLLSQQQQQNYYQQQSMMYSALQQQQKQQQAYQYQQQYMQYNNNNANMQWQQQQQMQYSQQNNPFACPRMNLLETARVWEYVDPQGKKQGKFTGTQMNDWLHAGYFTMDLKISCDGCTYMKLGQYLGQQTLSYQSQIQQQLTSGGVSNAYYYPIN